MIREELVAERIVIDSDGLRTLLETLGQDEPEKAERGS